MEKLRKEINKLKECSCEVIEKHKEVLGICPVCKNGHIARNKAGYGCSEWKNGCKFFIRAEIAGKKITIAQVKKLITKGKTDVIRGFRSKSGKPFDAALTLKDENIKFLSSSKGKDV